MWLAASSAALLRLQPRPRCVFQPMRAAPRRRRWATRSSPPGLANIGCCCLRCNLPSQTNQPENRTSRGRLSRPCQEMNVHATSSMKGVHPAPPACPSPRDPLQRGAGVGPRNGQLCTTLSRLSQRIQQKPTNQQPSYTFVKNKKITSSFGHARQQTCMLLCTRHIYAQRSAYVPLSILMCTILMTDHTLSCYILFGSRFFTSYSCL